MRISDWSSDVCSSDLRCIHDEIPDCLWLKVQYFLVKIFSELMSEFSRMYRRILFALFFLPVDVAGYHDPRCPALGVANDILQICGIYRSAYGRSEEHTSELQSLMPISYAVFCLKKQTYKRSSLHRLT